MRAVHVRRVQRDGTWPGPRMRHDKGKRLATKTLPLVVTIDHQSPQGDRRSGIGRSFGALEKREIPQHHKADRHACDVDRSKTGFAMKVRLGDRDRVAGHIAFLLGRDDQVSRGKDARTVAAVIALRQTKEPAIAGSAICASVK